MRTRNDYLEKVLASGREFFADHVATVTGTPGEGLWGVVWKKPHSSTYWMDLVCWRGVLYVRGDLGEAVYVWNDANVTPQFLLSCDVFYFFGKCMASEKGLRPHDWSHEIARAWLEEQREELRQESDVDPEVIEDLLSELHEHSGDLQDWRHYLEACYDSCDDPITNVFGQDAYIDGNLTTAGEVPAARCILHWLGLQMALKALGYGQKEVA